MDGPTCWLAATGDLMLNQPPRDPHRIKALFRGADLAVANLENPLTDRGYPADKLVTLRAAPSLAHELPRMGIGAVTLANNHALDYGVEGMLQTIDVVVDAGVRPCGTGPNWEAASEPLLIEVNGLWVAILSFACTVPTGWAAGPDRPGLAAIRVTNEIVLDGTIFEEQPGTSPYVRTEALAADVERAVECVRAARMSADIVIVAPHWGVPPGWAAAFQGVLADYQRPLGQALIEAGASLIVGNHAHVPLGFEVYRGVPIAYSLGNFMFHLFRGGGAIPTSRPAPPYQMEALHSPENLESFVLLARCSKRGVEELRLHPIVLDAAVEPVAAEGDDASRILERVRRLSPDPGVVEIRDGVGVVRLG